MAGLYIHIPFCESRCIYCGFYSTTSLKLRDDYVDALCKEMELRPIPSALGARESIETIYLGGGTPSQLTGSQLIRLFEAIRKNYLPDGFQDGLSNGFQDGSSNGFQNGLSNGFQDELPNEQKVLCPKMEITMECNPDDVTEEFCETLQQLPVNRVSMGAQTFSDHRLRFLHRRHNAAEVRTAIERLRRIGIRNISIDLMFGFPSETLTDWQSDIDAAIQLGVEHISAYSLMYEEGTALYRMLEQGKIEEIDEETSLQMYELLISRLTEAGYEHYEISNFARPGKRSRHNSSYWHEIPYIGIGAAAHSYKRSDKNGESVKNGENDETGSLSACSPLEAIRSWNVDDIREYISRINQGELPSESETLDLNTRYNDLITTALRTSDGINIKKMEQEFGTELAKKMMQEAEKHMARGLMKITNGKLLLTHQGLYISDDVMSDFMIV
mgnify:FL=1